MWNVTDSSRPRARIVFMPLRSAGYQVWEIQQTESTYFDSCMRNKFMFHYTMLTDRKTSKNVYLVVQAMVNRQYSITSERTIPIASIKFVGTSTLKDDWFSLGVSSPQEPDPLLNCVFKTEFFTHLKFALPGMNLKIAESYVFLSS